MTDLLTTAEECQAAWPKLAGIDRDLGSGDTIDRDRVVWLAEAAGKWLEAAARAVDMEEQRDSWADQAERDAVACQAAEDELARVRGLLMRAIDRLAKVDPKSKTTTDLLAEAFA